MKNYTNIKVFEYSDMPKDLQEAYIDYPYRQAHQNEWIKYKVARRNSDSWENSSCVALSSYFIKSGCKYGETVLIHF